MVGILFIASCLTGWSVGTAIEAAAAVFSAWSTNRGRGNAEHQKILDQVTAFLERHGDSRFSNMRFTGECSIWDRAGWWRESDDGTRDYLFTADALREATYGFDLIRVLDALQEAGAIDVPGVRGERAKAVRIGGRVMKLYRVDAGKLSSPDSSYTPLGQDRV